MKSKIIPLGTIRVGKDLKVYEKTKSSWKKSKQDIPEMRQIATMFKEYDLFDTLIDPQNNQFLKGQRSPSGMAQGARINILPNGKKLDKAYSLFAKNLTFHDESSHDRWDVLYQNPGGKYAYLYTQEKRQQAVKNKYVKVEQFSKHYKKLHACVTAALKDFKDDDALPMYTLISTYMRVGNEIYYRANGHKGLTTLKKKDVSIKGHTVSFNYLGKDGVPMLIAQEFPQAYVQRLKQTLTQRHATDFIFSDAQGVPLKDTHFMKAFEKYCGQRFYPHIVRSYYATQRAQDFLKSHKSATKEEVRELFSSIAEKLGHKRFSKEENLWKESHSVTIHYYLEPKTLQKIQSLTLKN